MCVYCKEAPLTTSATHARRVGVSAAASIYCLFGVGCAPYLGLPSPGLLGLTLVSVKTPVSGLALTRRGNVGGRHGLVRISPHPVQPPDTSIKASLCHQPEALGAVALPSDLQPSCSQADMSISGTSDDDRRFIVRERLASGTLFLVPRRIWTGYGTGHTCIVCNAIISSNEVENEILGSATVWAHSSCYSIWRQESDAFETLREQGVTNELLTELRSSRTDLARFVESVIRDSRPYLVIPSQAIQAWERREPQTWAKVVHWLAVHDVAVFTV